MKKYENVKITFINLEVYDAVMASYAAEFGETIFEDNTPGIN